MPDPGIPFPGPPTSGAREPHAPFPGPPIPGATEPPLPFPGSPTLGAPEPRHPPVPGPPNREGSPAGEAAAPAVHSPGRPSEGAAALAAAAPVERLEGRLEQLRRDRRGALVAYGVAGYPDLDGSLAAFRAMAEAGADVLEVGPPYSDPLIDGPVIQRAVTAALEAGTRMDDVLGLVKELTAGVDVPVVLLVYYNLVAHRGPRRFAAELAAAGACGAVVPDLPPEEADEWLEAAAAAGIAPVFLAAPTSTEARLAAVARAGRGFVYAQASLGVTGLRASLAAGIEELVGRVRAHTDLPVCAGIGVSNAEQAAAVASFADGAIVGTAMVRALGDAGLDGLHALTAELADAVHTARS
jgi:tryptophan synthase alpha chain